MTAREQEQPDRHPDQDTLDRIHELTRRIGTADEQLAAAGHGPGTEPLWEERQQLWRDRAALLLHLQDPGLWHPVCLAAELKITGGLLSEWEDTDDTEVVTFPKGGPR